jgi:hypothetical protein
MPPPRTVVTLVDDQRGRCVSRGRAGLLPVVADRSAGVSGWFGRGDGVRRGSRRGRRLRRGRVGRRGSLRQQQREQSGHQPTSGGAPTGGSPNPSIAPLAHRRSDIPVLVHTIRMRWKIWRHLGIATSPYFSQRPRSFAQLPHSPRSRPLRSRCLNPGRTRPRRVGQRPAHHRAAYVRRRERAERPRSSDHDRRRSWSGLCGYAAGSGHEDHPPRHMLRLDDLDAHAAASRSGQ